MKQLTLTIEDSKKPYYLRLAQALIASIKSGQVKCNEQLPSARALSEQLSVNRHTVMRSYSELVAQGWVENLERSYYRVSANLPVDSSLYQSKDSSTTPATFRWDIQKDFHDSNFIKSAAEFEFNFAGGQPDTSLFPFNEYRSHVNDALRRPRVSSLSYGENQGHPALLEQASIYLRRSRNLTDKQLIITNGSQEAIYLTAHLLLKKDDKVAVESLGYPPAWQAFKGAGAQLIAIKQDSQGLCPEHLAQMAAQHQLKCIYLTPLHQYPTTVTLSASRRMAIYKIALEHQLFIIEDDYDHEFHYKCQPISPMAANDPAQLVIYVSSFSKIMFPAARTGLLAVPPALLQPLVNFRTTINHKPALLMQDTLARWMASEGFERHIRRCAKAYQQRYENAQQQLIIANARGAQLDCHIPDGGMALWLKTETDTKVLAKQLTDHSIYVQHQAEFALTHFSQSLNQPLNHNPEPLNHLRLGYAGQSIERFNLGFSKIVELALLLQPKHTVK